VSGSTHRRGTYASADYCRAFVYLALGEIDDALPLIRQHAVNALTGRISRMANDSLLLFANRSQAYMYCVLEYSE
jgi:hypothetical protein